MFPEAVSPVRLGKPQAAGVILEIVSHRPLRVQVWKPNPNRVKGPATGTWRITITTRHGAKVSVLWGHSSSHCHGREVADGHQLCRKYPWVPTSFGGARPTSSHRTGARCKSTDRRQGTSLTLCRSQFSSAPSLNDAINLDSAAPRKSLPVVAER